MNVCIFYYDGFCEFEIVLAAAEFSSQNVITVALENKIYISEEKQKFVPDKTIEELNPDEVDLFIIPGGKPGYLYENSILKNFIKDMNKNKKIIAGICGGTKLLAAYGILDNKRCTGDSSGLKIDADYIDLFRNSIILEEYVVVDGNIITSTGQAFIEFAIKLGTVMNIYKDKYEIEKNYKWYKNIKE
ncbi:DJ-1/PfpI family protein [Clostridium amazonitimonense]|uniref:DJ-1/PfpI family protein n=1 Tax=Clostridium amazonitimonense TaxID=1499689 RepID=UPI000509DB39|nr:DJ-1/PfpI family protein [Clostridium amazonitimonense]